MQLEHLQFDHTVRCVMLVAASLPFNVKMHLTSYLEKQKKHAARHNERLSTPDPHFLCNEIIAKKETSLAE